MVYLYGALALLVIISLYFIFYTEEEKVLPIEEAIVYMECDNGILEGERCVIDQGTEKLHDLYEEADLISRIARSENEESKNIFDLIKVRNEFASVDPVKGSCPNGWFRTENKDNCYSCPSGYEGKDDKCFLTTCPEGTDPKQENCWKCPEGTVQNASLAWSNENKCRFRRKPRSKSAFVRDKRKNGTTTTAQFLHVKYKHAEPTPVNCSGWVDSNKCYTCPTNHRKTGYSNSSNKKCKIVTIPKYWTSPSSGADYYYKCPSGYSRRDGFTWGNSRACRKRVSSTKYKKKELGKGSCKEQGYTDDQGFYKGATFCYTCPSGFSPDWNYHPSDSKFCKRDRSAYRRFKFKYASNKQACPDKISADKKTCFSCGDYDTTIATIFKSDGTTPNSRKCKKSSSQHLYDNKYYKKCHGNINDKCITCPSGYTYKDGKCYRNCSDDNLNEVSDKCYWKDGGKWNAFDGGKQIWTCDGWENDKDYGRESDNKCYQNELTIKTYRYKNPVEKKKFCSGLRKDDTCYTLKDGWERHGNLWSNYGEGVASPKGQVRDCQKDGLYEKDDVCYENCPEGSIRDGLKCFSCEDGWTPRNGKCYRSCSEDSDLTEGPVGATHCRLKNAPEGYGTSGQWFWKCPTDTEFISREKGCKRVCDGIEIGNECHKKIDPIYENPRIVEV